jgi:acetyl-CoA carboxylase biotin carboxyl carrier protein
MSDVTGDRGEMLTDPFGVESVRELVRIVAQSDITELKIERGGSKLHLKRGNGQVFAAASAALPVSAPVTQLFTPPAAAAAGPLEMPAGHTITAPMVGTYYSSPSPKDSPFVQEGDEVRVGDTVGIVEAMKMMNEIESEFSGRVARLLVKNGQPVEYGQPLMVIEPV